MPARVADAAASARCQSVSTRACQTTGIDDTTGLNPDAVS